jgi:sensor domain CHASE-containing protein
VDDLRVQEVVTSVYITLLVVAGGVAAFWFAVYAAERRGRDDAEDEAREAGLEKVHEATKADDAVRRDAAAGRLLENDGHRRD